MDTEHVLCIASTRSCLLHPGLPVTLAQMHPPGKSGWNHRELAKAAGSGGRMNKNNNNNNIRVLDIPVTKLI